MGIIQNITTKEKIILFNQHTFGRYQNNSFVIQETDVSRKHAIIYWENNNWYLTDTSSNGTYINQSIVHHQTQKLKKNDIIRFTTAKPDGWKLISYDHPSCFLRALDKSYESIDLINDFICFESTNSCTLFKDKNMNWVLVNGASEITLKSGQEYTIGNKKYTFIENRCLNKTQRNIDISEEACFNILISYDEESVSSQIRFNNLTIDLGKKSFNHLLLHLARAKMNDIEQGTSQCQCGWVNVEDLITSLSKEMLIDADEYYINNLIFRLRKTLFKLTPYGYLFAHIIERQRGKLRFGQMNLNIDKEDSIPNSKTRLRLKKLSSI